MRVDFLIGATIVFKRKQPYVLDYADVPGAYGNDVTTRFG